MRFASMRALCDETDGRDVVEPMTVFDAARCCLDAAGLDEKVALTREFAEAFAAGRLPIVSDAPSPESIRMPGRPDRPRLVPPRDVPKRGLGSRQGRAAFLHAIAHIELNAIDLAWDAVYRFRGLPEAFYSDWVRVADDEARHFVMVRNRLQAFDHDYGDFDAHNGLWEMAEKTAADGMARMALVPRVMEARGLDVTPGMIDKLGHLRDSATIAVLEVILREEIAHVAAGSRWYRWYCEQAGVEPRQTFRALLQEYAQGYLRGPFNMEARLLAGFDEDEMRVLEQLSARIRDTRSVEPR